MRFYNGNPKVSNNPFHDIVVGAGVCGIELIS